MGVGLCQLVIRHRPVVEGDHVLAGPDGVFDQHGVLSLGPEAQASFDPFPDVLGSSAVCSALQDDGDEDEELLGVGLAVDDTEEFLRQSLNEESAYSSVWHVVALGWQADDSPPAGLPLSVVRDAPVQVRAIVTVDVVSIDRVEFQVHRGGRTRDCSDWSRRGGEEGWRRRLI